MTDAGKYRAYADNVLVILDKTEEELLASGLWLPAVQTSPIEAKQATVLATGPGVAIPVRLMGARRSHPVEQSPVVGRGWLEMETAPGDRVLLESRDAGDRLPVDVLASLGLREDRHYRVVRECEIAAVIE